MTDIPILLDLGLIVVAAAALVLVGRWFRMPAIIAYILAGLLLGPVTGILEATGTVELLANLGIALLLFLVGLEVSLEKIRNVGAVVFAAGIGQALFSAVGGAILAPIFGFSLIETAFIATALCFSSTVVVVKVLGEKRELGTLYGRIAIGIFLVQNLLVVVALAVLAGLDNPGEMGAGAVLRGIGLSFGGMFLLFGFALVSARYLLPRIFLWISPSPEGLFIWALTWCFLFVLGAQAIRVAPEIGAFVAGVSLAQLPFNDELRRRLNPLSNFFVTVFFVSLGVQMELSAAVEYWLPVTVLSLFILIGNPYIFLVIIPRAGYTVETAFLASVAVAQISEFSFVFAAVGMSAGLIDEGILSLIGLIGLITISGSVYLILYNHQLYQFFEGRGWLRWFDTGSNAREEDDQKTSGEGVRDHVLVVGMNSMGRRIVRELLEAGETVVAIDSDPAKLEGLPCPTIVGSTEHLSVLEEARYREAKMLVSALQIEDANTLLAFRGREAGVPTSIHAFDRLVVDELREIGVEHLIQSKNAGTRRLALEFMRLGSDAA